MTASSRRNLRWAAVGTAVLAAAGAQGGVAREAAADPLLDVPFTHAGDCAYECRTCQRGDNHDIVESVTRNAQSAHLETCNPGGCSSHAVTRR
jgi:hypothetical protein